MEQRKNWAAIKYLDDRKTERRCVMGFFDSRRGKSKPSESFSGGPGSTIEDAIVITAASKLEGIAMEYAHVERACGQMDRDWTLQKQELIQDPEGKPHDLLKIKLKDGTVREFYFDVSPFFGKSLF